MPAHKRFKRPKKQRKIVTAKTLWGWQGKPYPAKVQKFIQEVMDRHRF